jgi:hypothetical protein
MPMGDRPTRSRSLVGSIVSNGSLNSVFFKSNSIAASSGKNAFVSSSYCLFWTKSHNRPAVTDSRCTRASSCLLRSAMSAEFVPAYAINPLISVNTGPLKAAVRFSLVMTLGQSASVSWSKAGSFAAMARRMPSVNAPRDFDIAPMPIS